MPKKKTIEFKDLRYSSGGIGHTTNSLKDLVKRNSNELARFVDFEERVKQAKEKARSLGISVPEKIRIVE